ncbi:MAG: nucleotidyltransferase domain-containing protein [Verrucomicrobia bacterium]|nr:nucleotidyltransferase domain-containing protein [Verrucomicrobiota bacterium]
MLRTAPKSKTRKAASGAGGGALVPVQPGRRKFKQLPPPVEVIVNRLEPYCREHGIVQLDIFGSVSRGETRPGSDVDLIAKFRKIPGLHYFSMEKEMGRLLGVPVHLLLTEDVDEMTNPYRKVTIQRDRRTIYVA